MRLFRNTFFVLATSLAGMPIYFLTSIILARFLSVEDRGLYGVAMSAVAFTALLSELGFGPATIYRIRRVGVAPAKVATAALVATVGMSVFTCGLGYALGDWIRARFMADAPAWVLYAVLAAVPVQILWMMFGSIARGIDRFAVQNRSQLAIHAGRLVGMFLGLMVWHGALAAALAVYVGVLAAASLALMVQVLRETGLAAFDAGELRENFSFGLKSYAARVAGHVHERVDVFMIAYLLVDPRPVAYYSIAVALLAQFRVFPESVARALYPQLAGLSEDRIGAVAARVSRHSFLWVALSILLAAPAAPFLIPLIYGRDYTPSVVPFLVLLPGMALFTRYRVLSNFFVSLGDLRPSIIIQISAVAVNIILNAILIPRWGITGAAFASTVSHALAAVWVSALFLRQSGVGLRETFVFQREDMEPYRRRAEALFRRMGRRPAS